jgi:hypothetical protein
MKSTEAESEPANIKTACDPSPLLSNRPRVASMRSRVTPLEA